MFFGFGHYRFTFQAKTPIAFFNGDVGTTLRGAFGTILRQIVCIDRHLQCAQCPMRDKCVYSTIFSPVNQSGTGPKRQQTPPRGFVIKPPLNGKRRYDLGEAMILNQPRHFQLSLDDELIVFWLVARDVRKECVK